MRNSTIYRLILAALAIFAALTILAGCQRPQVGSPGYTDPSADKSAYKAADEYKYLVDVDQAIRTFHDMGRSTAMTESVSMSEAQIKNALMDIGIFGLKQKSITAEANSSMIHAHGAYQISTGEASLMGILAGAGTSEVKLPSHFPKDRLVGDMVIAHPDNIVKLVFQMIDEEMKGMSGLVGFEKPEDVYNWMGDELVLFAITNPSFDPKGEASATNTPFYNILAISSGKPEKGFDVIKNFMDFIFMIMSIEKPEGYGPAKVKGHDAFIIPAPDFANSSLADMMTPEQLQQLKDKKVPATAAVSVPGYLLIGDQPSVEAALDIFQQQPAAGTKRMATVEGETNLDLLSQSFNPTNPGYLLSIVGGESPEVTDLMQRFYDATRDIKELGSTRFSLVAPSNTEMEIDVTTSRESIKFFQAVEKVIRDTPKKTWEAIGRKIGEWVRSQNGMGGPPMGTRPSHRPSAPGGDQHEFHFPPAQPSGGGSH